MHYIYFPTETGETKTMRKFSFLKFLETFTKFNLLVDICASRLQPGNDAYNDIFDAFEKNINLVNSEGVWTVYGWVKRSLINNVSILGNDIKDPGDNKVLFQEISTHVVHLQPSKKYYIGGLLTTSNLTFLHYKCVIAINPNVGISLYI